jgi:hypothetical protein
MSEKSLKGHAERTGVDLLPASEGLTSQRAERGEDGRRAYTGVPSWSTRARRSWL